MFSTESRGTWSKPEILAALEALRPSLDRAPSPERLRPDLTGLGEAFGATGSVGGKSE